MIPTAEDAYSGGRVDRQIKSYLPVSSYFSEVLEMAMAPSPNSLISTMTAAKVCRSLGGSSHVGLN